MSLTADRPCDRKARGHVSLRGDGRESRTMPPLEQTAKRVVRGSEATRGTAPAANGENSRAKVRNVRADSSACIIGTNAARPERPWCRRLHAYRKPGTAPCSDNAPAGKPSMKVAILATASPRRLPSTHARTTYGKPSAPGDGKTNVTGRHRANWRADRLSGRHSRSKY